MTPDLVDRLIEDWKRERPDLDPEPMACVGRLLRLGRMLDARANEAMRRFGVGYTDFDVLATLRRSGDPFRLTPTELRACVLLTSGAMAIALKRLEAARMIKRSEDDEDGRVKWVKLTTKGRNLVDKAISERFAEAEEALSSLSQKDRRMLANLLKNVESAL